MKKKIYFYLFFLLIIFSCSENIPKELLNNEVEKVKLNNDLETIKEDYVKSTDLAIIDSVLESEKKEKNIINDKNVINKENIVDNNINKEENVIRNNENVLNIKFYSQFPSHEFNLPFDEYCEEASFLNGYYYLKNIKPTLEEYMFDLQKIKEIEDKLFGENGYVNTSTNQTLLVIYFFQAPEFLDLYLSAENDLEKENIKGELILKNSEIGYVNGKIISKPTIENLIKEIDNGNPVIIPVYGRALKNKYFTNLGPIYHNILLKGYDGENFIFNEVGTIRGDSFKYSKNLIIKNIHDYYPELYPDNFIFGSSNVLVLYKNEK